MRFYAVPDPLGVGISLEDETTMTVIPLDQVEDVIDSLREAAEVASNLSAITVFNRGSDEDN